MHYLSFCSLQPAHQSFWGHSFWSTLCQIKPSAYANCSWAKDLLTWSCTFLCWIPVYSCLTRPHDMRLPWIPAMLCPLFNSSIYLQTIAAVQAELWIVVSTVPAFRMQDISCLWTFYDSKTELWAQHPFCFLQFHMAAASIAEDSCSTIYVAAAWC